MKHEADRQMGVALSVMQTLDQTGIVMVIRDLSWKVKHLIYVQNTVERLYMTFNLVTQSRS